MSIKLSLIILVALLVLPIGPTTAQPVDSADSVEASTVAPSTTPDEIDTSTVEMMVEPAAESSESTESTEPSESTESTDSAESAEDPAGAAAKTVSVSFRDAELSQIATFFGEALDKPVLIHQSIANIRLTVMSNNELTTARAFELIGNALRQQGVIIVESARQLELLPLDQIRRINRPVIQPDASVADIEDQSTIVDKMFKIEHYDVVRLKDLVVPMLPDYAFLIADPNLGRLVVTAAAADLVHIERLVASLDVPLANNTIERVFVIEHGDASEIASMVRTILAGTLGNEALAVFTTPAPNRENRDNQNNRRNSRNNNNNRASESSENTMFVERSEAPIMIQADLSRNWIIAAAPRPPDGADRTLGRGTGPAQRA